MIRVFLSVSAAAGGGERASALPAAVAGARRPTWRGRLRPTAKLQVPPSVRGGSVAAGDGAQMKLELETQSL